MLYTLVVATMLWQQSSCSDKTLFDRQSRSIPFLLSAIRDNSWKLSVILKLTSGDTCNHQTELQSLAETMTNLVESHLVLLRIALGLGLVNLPLEGEVQPVTHQDLQT